jgi:hypothetical protein
MEIEITKNIFLPKSFLGDFYVEKVEEINNQYKVTIYENPNNIPQGLLGKKTVLNGFCDKLELVDNLFKGELLFLTIYRRKWKEKGKTESFFNTYNLHKKGCKLTQEFGDFLKELTRQKRSELFASVKGLQSLWEENKLLV